VDLKEKLVVSPFGGTGKIPWKIEWAVKWKVIGVTIEGAGKDHMTAGGSHDVAARICKRVLNYPVPYPFSHEFFLIEGKKMASSKGRGASAKEVAEIIPPYLLRFLMARVKYSRAIDFDPTGWTIPDLFDEYDRAAKVYWKEGIKKDQVVQMSNLDAQKYFEEKKGAKFTDPEKKELLQRIKYAKIWLDGHAPKEAIFKIQDKLPEEAKKLSKKQKEYLGELANLINKAKDAPEFEKKMYELAKELDLPTKDAFQAIYLVLLGKSHGPKAAWLIMGEKKSKVTKQLKEAAE
jgi:lysyl-tRNA synthetase class 1